MLNLPRGPMSSSYGLAVVTSQSAKTGLQSSPLTAEQHGAAVSHGCRLQHSHGRAAGDPQPIDGSSYLPPPTSHLPPPTSQRQYLVKALETADDCSRVLARALALPSLSPFPPPFAAKAAPFHAAWSANTLSLCASLGGSRELHRRLRVGVTGVDRTHHPWAPHGPRAHQPWAPHGPRAHQPWAPHGPRAHQPWAPWGPHAHQPWAPHDPYLTGVYGPRPVHAHAHAHACIYVRGGRCLRPSYRWRYMHMHTHVYTCVVAGVCGPATGGAARRTERIASRPTPGE